MQTIDHALQFVNVKKCLTYLKNWHTNRSGYKTKNVDHIPYPDQLLVFDRFSVFTDSYCNTGNCEK